jgi:hypothetical protein
MNSIATLNDIENKYNIKFNENDYLYTNNIIDIFNDNIINTTNPILLNAIGLYYRYKNINYTKMKKYFDRSIKQGNSDSMYNLASYYDNIVCNYDTMKKYLLMAIDKRNPSAMCYLGYYYHYLKIDYTMMKKYYLMAIEHDNVIAMNNLGHYYTNVENNSLLGNKYYMMAIEKGYMHSFNNYLIYLKKSNSMIQSNYITNFIKFFQINGSGRLYYMKNFMNVFDWYDIHISLNINIDCPPEYISYINKLCDSTINGNCDICMYDNVKMIKLNCSHYICNECYKQLYYKPCPFCRAI